jgi:hypothetical protein
MAGDDPEGGVDMSARTAHSGVGEAHFNFHIRDINLLLPPRTSGRFRARSVFAHIQVGDGNLPDLSQQEVYCDGHDVEPSDEDPNAPAAFAAIGCVEIRVQPGAVRTWTLVVDAHGHYTAAGANGRFVVSPAKLSVRFRLPVTVQATPTPP